MSYFKNVELAKKYHISEGTVRNWIKAALKGKLEIALHEEKGKFYIANLPTNSASIERLVENHRKYRNTIALKTIKPKLSFYETFSEKDVYEIVRNIEVHHEIPRQYNYFDGGANEWDTYSQNLVKEREPNLLNSTIGLLSDNYQYLDRLIAKYKYINVVDIGPGNALPVKNLLAHLLKQKTLGRYTALDISPAMLEITKRNISEWFDNSVAYDEHTLDITHERFGSLLSHDHLDENTSEWCNLVLLLGGTPYNFRKPDDVFRTIHESMNVDDILVYTDKLETDGMRPEWFDRDAKPGKLTISPRHRLVFDMLNIDDSFYDVEMGFDERLCQHYTRTRFKVEVVLQFKFGTRQHIVTLKKGTVILLWRSWQITDHTYSSQFLRNDFYLTHTSQTDDHSYIMAVAQIKQD